MTMDINNVKPDINTEIYVPQSDDRTELVGKSVKRPFDVAFLMLPDDKMKQKRLTKLIDYNAREVDTPPEVPSPKSATPSNDTDDSDEEIEVGNHEHVKVADFSKSKYISQKQQVFDDPNITKHQLKPTPDENRGKLGFRSSPDQKSAFTKVHMNKEARVSPNLSISPDLSYQNSLSPSPPIIINRNYQNFANNFPIFKSQPATYPNNYMADSFNTSSNAQHNQHQQQQHHQQQQVESHFHNINKASMVELVPHTFSKMRPMLAQYRPEQMHYNYQHHHQELFKMSQAQAAAAAAAAAVASNGPDLSQIRNPAAAILSSLLPPSLAALSLPAQNVCAICNITFRMTSDLVYHMRSHHKNENTEYSRRKREDKLKCPVCAESFRERHHLTRHMTAHQDKDNDVLEPGMKKKSTYAAAFSK